MCVCVFVCMMCVCAHMWYKLEADVKNFPQLIFIFICWARVSAMNWFLLIG